MQQVQVRAALLLDQISDPLEAVANLVYLLEGEAGDSPAVREYGRLLTNEVERVLAVTQKCLHSDCSAVWND